ncbi:Uncharacterised protein [Mycobacteroides abscessus subsp. abscessus]|nr:Uncharacterised protein [Mycobacteroides abscessus subsp. abscessus]
MTGHETLGRRIQNHGRLAHQGFQFRGRGHLRKRLLSHRAG